MRKWSGAWLLLMVVLFACVPEPPLPDPFLVQTAIAGTAAASWTQTAQARARWTATPSPQPPSATPSRTPSPTPTFLILLETPTLTPTVIAIPLAWPDWKTGEVVKMPKESGANLGVNKFFSVLQGVPVVVTRLNGVKLRKAPSKVAGAIMAAYGDLLTLTGFWNQNYDFGWSFVQVKASDGRLYWVGGDVGTEIDPTNSLRFYSPYTLTPSPTATGTPTPRIFYTLTPAP
ncbi:MAG: hypothetical protein J7555_03275 [Chloroflexi bacterium]|jgi:hypothetical protein|nr:hypothetical protein [Chloroflexota bacterium]